MHDSEAFAGWLRRIMVSTALNHRRRNVFALDERAHLGLWVCAGRTLDAVDRLLSRAEVRVTPTDLSDARSTTFAKWQALR